MPDRGVRRAALGCVLVVLAGSAAGCRVAYLPSQENAVDRSATDPAALRRLVRVLPRTCSGGEAGGIVRNGADRPLRVTVEVSWSTRTGTPATASVAVGAPAGGEAPFTVRAPAGATAEVGCQAFARGIAPVP